MIIVENEQMELTSHEPKTSLNAQGSVLEIGIGGGGLLALYNVEKVSEVFGIDPHPGMIAMAVRRSVRTPFPVKLVCGSAEEIPLDADEVDTVVSTLTFCSIPDLPRALGEMRRVLRPGGHLLFLEHGLHPDPAIADRQRRGETRHKWLYNGCHLTREIPKAIEDAGFTFVDNEAGEHPFGWMFPRIWGWYGAAI